jgi:heme-degrading monooxygenase HmoA
MEGGGVAEIFTTGRWKPNAGKEDAFVEAWTGFAAWASKTPGAGTLRLTRDLRDVEVFLSFGAWQSIAAVRAWKSAPDFRERLARVLQHVDTFEPSELALVAAAEAGAAAADSSHPSVFEPVHVA